MERNQEGNGLDRLGWDEPKEGDTVGGARLTIETCSLFWFFRTFDDPASCAMRPLCFSSGFSSVSQHRRTGFIKSTEERDFSSDVAQRDGAFGERFPVLSGSKRREKDVSLSDLFPRMFRTSADASHSRFDISTSTHQGV
jgi:hypothetical protein